MVLGSNPSGPIFVRTRTESHTGDASSWWPVLTKKAMTVSEEKANLELRELCLDQFLKLSSVAGTGGHAKFLIQNGEVTVNGETETRRRRKLFAGDVVEVGGKQLLVNDSLFVK